MAVLRRQAWLWHKNVARRNGAGIAGTSDGMTGPVRKAVFPVGGLGTRFLPATKAMPKEMLPVVDKPLIQYAVEEAQSAGIEEFIFVTGRGKGIIEDHFDHAYELEALLRERGKTVELNGLLEDLPASGSVSFTRQQSPLGLGHAVWCARELVGHEPFALLLPDVLVQYPRGCLAQMIDAAASLDGNANIIAVEEVPAERVHMYGVVGVGAAARAVGEGVLELGARRHERLGHEAAAEVPKPPLGRGLSHHDVGGGHPVRLGRYR